MNAISAVKPEWHFSKVNARFRNREATQGEFFAGESDLRAFIREAVQNSLDARRPDAIGPVAVRIFVSGDVCALDASRAARWFRGGWDHFQAPANGLPDAPTTGEPCRFVVFEDSGTTGLTGDPTQFHDIPGVRNPFYYFCRAEGQSNKQASARGRWGLGKFVFPRSSRLRCFFALTQRCDDRRRLLVGQAVLRSHEVDGRSYTPDGWFGGRPSKKEAAAPVEDREVLRRFEQDFCLERGADAGLSVVIPFCDPTWTVRDITECVLQEYFSPILREQLIVLVEGDGDAVSLNAQSLPDVLPACSPPLRDSMQPLIELATWSAAGLSADRIELPMAAQTGPPRSLDQQLGESTRRTLRNQFQRSGRLAVRMPLWVQRKGDTPRPASIDVLLAPAAAAASPQRAVFVRQGIVVSDVRSRSLKQMTGLVLIDDPPVSAFLGDAENPAHTEWQETSSHFRGRYQYGAATLRLVRNAAAELCQILAEPSESEDQELLLDVFSVGAASSGLGLPVGFAARSSSRLNHRLSRIGTDHRRKQRSFRLTRRRGGFRLAGAPSQAGACLSIRIQLAYDRQSGHPLRRYAEADFRLDLSPVVIEASSEVFTIESPNCLVVRARGPFELVVTGFDVNRDLYVKATHDEIPGRQRRS